MCTTHAGAQEIPGSADGSRIKAPLPNTPRPADLAPDLTAQGISSVTAPAGSESISFILNGVNVKGATAFTSQELGHFYGESLGKTVTLDIAWKIAAQITDLYKQSGYFLSRAYVPAQSIENGIIHITIAEGFIEDIVLSGGKTTTQLIPAWTERLKSYRPLRSQELEEAMLELNSLPGLKFRAVLNPPLRATGEEGAASLNLIASLKEDYGRVQLDNFGSRYLGPYEAGLSYNSVIIPNQNTAISVLASMPADELKTMSLRHTIPFAPQYSFDLSGSYTTATPGFRLKPREIESRAYSVGAELSYQMIRQRTENLKLGLGFEWRDSKSDILGTPLSEDRLRLLKADLAYDLLDRWNGYDSIGLSLTQGVSGLGATKDDSLLASRAEARPDFTKLGLTVSRLQRLSDDFDAFVSLDGQVASGPLYSSEEFGFGGQNAGRAYDNSEITGDHGVSLALELRYNGLNPAYGFAPLPYAFYDIGQVWNEDTGQSAKESASSAGVGLRARHERGLSTSLEFAVPLTRPLSDPLYGVSESGPRFSFSLSHDF